MKAILEFNLPEDKLEFGRVQSVEEVYYILYEIQQFFRNIRKYQSTENQELLEFIKDEKNLELISLIETEFHKIVSEQGIEI